MSFTKRCSCGQIMVFHRTKANEWMPCNPGYITILDPKTGQVHTGLQAHHTTCPHADRYKKRSKND